jgi:transcriptional antiterminator NusG
MVSALIVRVLVVLDGGRLVEQIAQLVDALQQAGLSERIERKFHRASVGQMQTARAHVDAQHDAWRIEQAVERNLRERIDRSEMKEKFGRILVPMEEVVELKNGKKSVSERRFFPGYVLVEMEMGDDTWHLVKHTSKVTGFVGGAKTRPSPISEAEVMKIVSQMQEGVEKPRPKVQWEVGETVRIKEGPFTDFNGSVEDVNYDKSKVRVAVTIFGRATPVELDFAQVEKV